MLPWAPTADSPGAVIDTQQAPPGRPVTVLLAEDDPAMRLALAALVTEEVSLQLVGVARDAEEAIRLAAQHRPRVCVVDVGMPGGGGPHAARVIAAHFPETAVLALSGREDRATVVEMIRAGACGYLVKGHDPAELIRAVHAAAHGRRMLSSQLTDSVVSELAEQLRREDAPQQRLAQLRARIDEVLDGALLSMVFQPIMALEDRRVVAMEALARFTVQPHRPPDIWFAEAAEAGRLLALELAAADAALRHLDELPSGCALSINLSPTTAASAELAQLLPAHAADRIILEITEHAPIGDYDDFTPRLDRLRDSGVRLAIDDAGAGFSSLRHILRLAPDIIKTDISLTRHIQTSRPERALTRALISFASEIDATIVAEGIESAAELHALRQLGVTHGQGFHLGRPAPLRSGDQGSRTDRPAHERAPHTRRAPCPTPARQAS